MANRYHRKNCGPTGCSTMKQFAVATATRQRSADAPTSPPKRLPPRPRTALAVMQFNVLPLWARKLQQRKVAVDSGSQHALATRVVALREDTIVEQIIHAQSLEQIRALFAELQKVQAARA